MRLNYFAGRALFVLLTLALFTSCSSKLTRNEAAKLLMRESDYDGVNKIGEELTVVASKEAQQYPVFTSSRSMDPGHPSPEMTEEVLSALERECYISFSKDISKIDDRHPEAPYYIVTMSEKGRKKFKQLPHDKNNEGWYPPNVTMWTLSPVCDFDIVVTGVAQDGPRALVNFYRVRKNFRDDTKFLEPIFGDDCDDYNQAPFFHYDDGWRVE